MDESQNSEPLRRRLGRGLNALLGTGAVGSDQPLAAGNQSEISVELIERNPFQPRVEFDQTALNELADSIRQHGVLQPLLVRLVGDHYQLIAGERRLLAAKKTGLEQVPCRVLEVTDQQVYEVSLEENLKRQDLNVLEKATAFQDYLSRFGCSIEELGRRLSLDRSTVSNMLRLLELPEEVKADLRNGKITAGHARALLPLPADQQLAVSQQIQKSGLSVRKTEELVREQTQPAVEAPNIIPMDGTVAERPGGMTNHLLSLQDQLRDLLGAKVEIKLKGKDKGRIVIEFQTNDEFERILGQLRRAA